jgi:nitrous oxidase accessory protein
VKAILIVVAGAASLGAQQIDVAPTGAVRSIAAAVAAAPPASRIVVHAGVYREPTIVVDKPLEIIGDQWPVLDGEGQRSLLVVKADDVTVRGLVLRNVGTSFVEDRAALRVNEARGCVIDDNRFENTFFGVYLANVTDCRVERNVLRATAKTEAASGNGIHLWSSRRITIADNDIMGHRDGIYFEFVHNSVIERNRSEGNNRYGLHFMYSDDCRYVDNVFRHNGSGVAVMFTKRVEMVANRFEDNWGAAAYGLLLKEITDSLLTRNVFHGNTTGLLADGASRLIATDNEFSDNGWAVKLDANTQDGRFERNAFVGNTFDVATNSREHSTTFAGNYWDDYRGYDLNKDGVGDVPHRPVRLFSLLVARNQPSLILLRSVFVGLLDAAERVLPALTPEMLTDATPSMRRRSLQ